MKGLPQVYRRSIKGTWQVHLAWHVPILHLWRGSSSCSRERGQATGSRSGAVCGLRSGAAAREDAELVPLWVGKYDPALIALADVGVPGTEVEQATDLFVLLPVGWVDVEVEPVLDGLALGQGFMF